MPIGILFWVLMILWLIFGLVPPPPTIPGWRFGAPLLLFVLLALLGWRIFGPVLQ